MDNTVVDDVNGFGLIDFMDEANLEKFMELIRGESAEPIVSFCENYDCEHIAGCLPAAAGNQLFDPTPPGFSFDWVHDTDMPYAFDNTIPGEIKLAEEEDEEGGEENDDEESSGTTTTPIKKGDRAKTLICERKRRGRMKEKLYALRSLVPNISKMDKASIIRDAVVYVQDLQMQAKKLKAEIAGLESSIKNNNNQEEGSFTKKMDFINHYPVMKTMYKMELCQVEAKGFYVKLVCNKGQQVAVSLYKALESLTGFTFQSSNLATSADNYILTFTLNVKECEVDINSSNLKLWIASAFLNQGFDFQTSLLA